MELQKTTHFHFKTMGVLLSVLIILGFLTGAAAQSPGKSWEQYLTPEEAGWSGEKLREIYKQSGASALMIVYKGKVAAAFGDIRRRFKCHSVRKSLLNALYGILVDKGTIDLDNTLEALKIDDIASLTAAEKQARIRDLLKCRSGVYHPAAAETDQMKAQRPRRGSHKRDTYWYYNNWDFNVLGTIFEQKANADIFEFFLRHIAAPLQMEDFRIIDGTHDYEREYTIHPAYPFKMSARDMARFGQLYLQKGKWDGKQIISEKWIAESMIPYSSVPDRETLGYGYLWWIDENFNGSRMFFASGVGGQFIGVFPARQVVIVIRADTYAEKSVKNRFDAIRKMFAARIHPLAAKPKFIPLRLSVKRPKLNTIPLVQKEFTRYVGEYRFNDKPFLIKHMDGGLILENYHYYYKFRLLPVAQGTFFIEDMEEFLFFEPGVEGGSINVDFHKSKEIAKLYHTILDRGIDAGITLFREIKNRIDDEYLLKSLADRFGKEEKRAEAMEVLRLNVLLFPGSLSAHREFIKRFSDVPGEGASSKRLKALADIYDRLLKESTSGLSGDSPGLSVLRWYTQWLKARAYPLPISDEEKKRIVGTYGPRHVIVKKGDLYYYRDSPKITMYPMVKLSENLFALDDNYPDIFRIQFVMGKNNQAIKLIGIFLGGQRDESVRGANKSK
ncbi:MAG: serine hydrolase [Candidatus Aminicenantes bacterium]|nr:serine hydrolase [Candidatus Aminicenantes bacterium]NIM78698.1 serine hydrolase [Candidatus Aminicenantes bacterium]NIN17946.1 serine hydrolase [Candidatus Aminicenantes bacterium]NIN41849.1 serine hydrolase [Candidatus Aminicenantes bacterium]NIN84601.1 serine hydrolase [Candidatus Aminicenantes bacterium]